MKLRSGILIASALFASCIAITSRAPAQDQPAGQNQAKADKGTTAAPAEEKAPLKIADWLDIALEHRTRYETLDHRFKLGEVGSDQQLPQRTRLRLGIRNILGPVGFMAEFEDDRVHLDDSGSTITNTMVNENDILQLYASVAFNKPEK